MTRPCHLLLVLSLVVLGCAPATSGVGALQLCGVQDYDADQKKCRDNAARTNVVTADLVCALPVENANGATARGTYFYAGEAVHTFTADVTTDKGTLLFFLERPGLSQVPGGSWRCEMTVGGETRSATLESSGPTDWFLDTAVCPTSTTLDEAVAVCGVDHSTRGMVQTDRVTCSASLVGLSGHRVQTTLEHDGVGVMTSVGIVPDMPLSSYAKDFAAPAGFVFSTGVYDCIFSVDGREAARKSAIMRAP